jgi:hypothetical protein
MLSTVKVVLFASALLMRGGILYAGANASLCCDSFDGTTATNCTLTGDEEQECNRTLVVLDCENSGQPDAVECSPANTKLAASRIGNGGGGQNGQNCRCVTVSFGSP